jgi:tetratricopeptide (TPR) repeat protein
LGHVERHRGNTKIAIARHEGSLALFRELGHQWSSAYTLANLGVVALECEELERALALLAESFLIYRGLGDEAHKRGEKERAAVLYEEALALQRELGNERGVARTLARLTTCR